MAGSPSRESRGAIVSVASSVLFAGIYFITPLLAPAPAEAIWALRTLCAIPIIALALLAARQWYLVAELARRIRLAPVLALGVIACGALIAVQLWVFTWAPLHGRGLQVALGYFLLPLMLVLVGKFVYRDRLLWWQWTAAAIAAVGVAFELVRAGGVSWETLLVAIGYPVYFVLRRTLGFAHLGGMFWEFVAMSPIAAILLARELVVGTALAVNPTLLWLGPVFGIGTGFALVCYILASRLLTISVFGLLGYLEPALLVGASMLNGERIAPGEYPLYIAIWLAVLVLIGGGIVGLLRRRRTDG
ncbi:EamA family transporter RarD [Leucobacter sp. USCH14]|uniref:EamA family transporter RarD n=1 Tax=Leucobacter sp. USCH14 TaxID=3024838 RepID=UPI003095201A